MEKVYTYIAYLTISITLTIWVARTLHKNGRQFLVDAFRGNEKIADSVNHLLVVGFYLINLGFVSWNLRIGYSPKNVAEIFEVLSTQVGTVLLILGCMHFFNLFVLGNSRKKGRMPRPAMVAENPSRA